MLSKVPQRVWTDEEWERIQRGFRAQDMDDRRHLFAEDDRLFLHRSAIHFNPVAPDSRGVLGIPPHDSIQSHTARANNFRSL